MKKSLIGFILFVAILATLSAQLKKKFEVM